MQEVLIMKDFLKDLGYGMYTNKFTVTGEDSITICRGNTKLKVTEGTIKLESGNIEIVE